MGRFFHYHLDIDCVTTYIYLDILLMQLQTQQHNGQEQIRFSSSAVTVSLLSLIIEVFLSNALLVVLTGSAPSSSTSSIIFSFSSVVFISFSGSSAIGIKNYLCTSLDKNNRVKNNKISLTAHNILHLKKPCHKRNLIDHLDEYR